MASWAWWTPTCALALAVILGTALRVLPLLGLDFPLGDGGMFSTMAQDLRAGGYRLPSFTSYNGGNIPFAYPPLGIYVLAGLPGDPTTTELWLPLVWSVGTILAFWVFARTMLDDDLTAIATIAFALLPAAYAWQIMGGGVTRGPEQLLSLLALACVVRLLDAPGWRFALPAVATVSLATLTHPFAPLVIAGGTAALWLLRSRRWKGAAWLAGVGLASVAVIAPWVAAVASHHGIEPFVDALGTHTGVPDRWVAVAIAVALAPMIGWIAIPIADRLNARPAFLAVLLVTAVSASAASRFAPGSVVYAVPPEIRAEMLALERSTSSSTTFAVWTGNEGDDHIVEWFPAITGRISIGTYQGAEWRGDWAQTVATHISIQRCRCANGADLLWISEHLDQ